MKIIFAQGNPGADYAASRHNTGFMLADTFAGERGLKFSEKTKFKALVAESTLDGEKFLLVKPTTYYNETGQSARALIDFYKCDPARDLLVVHDDIALPLGTLRVRQNGRPAGNNGVKSINAHIGPDYWRLRVGIYATPRDQMPDADFVLGRFAADEAGIVAEHIVPAAINLIEEFISGHIKPASYSAPKS